MEGKARPTRWQKARTDWSGIRARREIISGLVGAAVSVVVLTAAGFGHDALVVGITVGGSALAAAVLLPAAELAWNWLQAPMRLLTGDVIAIRERLDAVEIIGAQRPKLDPRLTLINHKRVGDELVADAARYGRFGDTLVTEDNAKTWTDSVIADFHEHESSADQLERFLTAGTGSSSERMAERLALLGELIEGMQR